MKNLKSQTSEKPSNIFVSGEKIFNESFHIEYNIENVTTDNVITLLNDTLNNLSGNLSNIFISTVKENTQQMANKADNLSMEYVDMLLLNISVYLGYPSGTLRTAYYSYLTSMVLRCGLNGWSYNYIFTVFMNKVVAEINYILANESDYMYNFTPFVFELMLPSMIFHYNQAMDFRNEIIFYINDLYNYINNFYVDINRLFDLYNHLNNTMDQRITSIVVSYLDVWYAYWDWWHVTHWEVLLEELEDFEHQYYLFTLHVREIEIEVGINTVRIADIADKILKPFSNVMNYKNSNPDLYDYELHILYDLITDTIAFEHPPIRETILHNLEIILGMR